MRNKTQRVAVLASTRTGRVKVGEMSIPKPAPAGTEVFPWDDGHAVTLAAAKRLGYPAADGASRTRVVVGAGGKVRG